MHFKKNLSLFPLGAIFLIIMAAGFWWNNFPEVTGASSPVPSGSVVVTGDAWSSNIGWIKFNPSYGGVFYNKSTGALSGYAWSSNIGWIKFGNDSTGNLSADQSGIGGAGATASPKTGIGYFSGWARACAGAADGQCNNMTSRTDGWDGWIRFDHNKSNPVSINFTTGYFSGYAWGSEVVGWISFSGSNYQVSIPGVGGVVGSCNTSLTGTYVTKPTNGCNEGTQDSTAPSDTTTEWKWTCRGSDSSSFDDDISCSAAKSGTKQLTIQMTGDGSGKIWQESPTISGDNMICEKTGGVTKNCDPISYASGENVKLKAGTSSGNSTFINGWSGCNTTDYVTGNASTSGNNKTICKVTMSDNKTVQADFGYSSTTCTDVSCGCVENCGDDTSVPSVPTNLSATTGSCGTATINLTWNDTANETYYNIQRDGSFLKQVSSNTTSYSDAATDNSSNSYSYKIQACNTNGCSPYSGGTSGISPSQCSKNGVCGNANGKTFSSISNVISAGLCSSGDSSSVVDAGSLFKWTCYGSDGGIDIPCAANDSSGGGGGQPPTATLWADKTTIAPGSNTVIHWDMSNVNECRLWSRGGVTASSGDSSIGSWYPQNYGWGSYYPYYYFNEMYARFLCPFESGSCVTGSQNTANLFENTEYNLNCRGTTGKWYNNKDGTKDFVYDWAGGGLTIEVRSAVSPTVSITCDPVSCKGYKGVAAGNNGALKLSYSAADADGDLNSTTCKFTGGGGIDYNSCSGTYWPTSDLVSGSYTATMYAADDGNRSSNASQAYTILEDIQADFDCSLDNSVFQSCSDIIAARNNNVYFKDMSTASGGASLSSWSWSFENGNPGSSSKQNPDTKFTSTGSNNVILTVTDNSVPARTKSITQQIQVREPLKPVWKEVIPR